MPELISCNLCGADNTRLLYRLRDYRLLIDDTEWNVVQCRSCGLGYLNPRPTAQEITRYYPQNYFDQRRTQTARYRRQAKYVTGVGGSLLDIGAATGEFIKIMAERGWSVSGIEPSEEAGNAHGLQIYRQRFPDECDLEAQRYDVITAWAVFEHLHDPAAAFRECSRLLSLSGRLIVQVPNLRSIYSRWALQEDVPRHLYFFSPKTLRAYGRDVGLELERVTHTTDLFGGSGRGVLRLALVRALGHSIPDFFEIWRTGRRDRFRRWPVLAAAWTGVAAVERVLLTDRVVRAARVSGQIVAEFTKAASANPSSVVGDRRAA
jgi:2-polyprenyl-3-methyl-5-hydroxy-6-metoxy-1,4-benzoquinol methylase